MAKKKKLSAAEPPPVVDPIELPVADVAEPQPVADIPESQDRPPVSGENPRHAVLICEDRDEVPRRVTARNPGEHTVNIEGVIYHHTHEDKDGWWIYTRLRPKE